MQQVNYPFKESHLQEHRRFIENLGELERQVEAGKDDPRYLTFRIELLLLDWFSTHSSKSDRHLAKFTQLKSAGGKSSD